MEKNPQVVVAVGANKWKQKGGISCFYGDLESVNSHIDAVTIWSLNTCGIRFLN